jgi:hypothetical protein
MRCSLSRREQDGQRQLFFTITMNYNCRYSMRDLVEAEEGALAAQFLHPGVGDFIEGVELVSTSNIQHPTSNFQHGKAGHSHPKPEVIRDS